MATRFEALDELFDDALTLPVTARDGKTRDYRIPSPSAEDGLRIQRITVLATRLMSGGKDLDTEVLNDEEERDLIADALGPADAEMQKDGVDWAWRKHAGLTAVIWITRDLKDAEMYWKAAGDPTRLAVPNRETRRAAAKTSGSAAAPKTRKRASSSTTSGPRAGKSAPRASQV